VGIPLSFTTISRTFSSYLLQDSSAFGGGSELSGISGVFDIGGFICFNSDCIWLGSFAPRSGCEDGYCRQVSKAYKKTSFRIRGISLEIMDLQLVNHSSRLDRLYPNLLIRMHKYLELIELGGGNNLTNNWDLFCISEIIHVIPRV
jgi:hypothetical protein